MGRIYASNGLIGYRRRALDLGAALAVAIAACGVAMPAKADVVPISGYDINDAVESGHGNWSHTYDGTITDGVPFVNYTYPGTTATYSGGGSGTLNDGVIGSSISNTQLFVTPAASDGTTISPVIYLTLPYAYSIDTIEIYGGNISDNAIPGAITGFSVGLLDENFNLVSPVAFTTTDFGPETNSLGGFVNDSVSLVGSALEGVPAYTVILSDFLGTADVGNWFSITEIKLYGTQAVQAVPVPAALPVIAAALGGFGFAGWRQRRNGA